MGGARDGGDHVTSILPASASGLMHALDEAVGARLAALPCPAPDHRSPSRCASELLPELARERGLIVWEDRWPLVVRREAVRLADRDAALWGTQAAVEKVLEDFGALYTITRRDGKFAVEIRVRNVNTLWADWERLKTAVCAVARASVACTFVEGEAFPLGLRIQIGTGAALLAGFSFGLYYEGDD